MSHGAVNAMPQGLVLEIEIDVVLLDRFTHCDVEEHLHGISQRTVKKLVELTYG